MSIVACSKSTHLFSKQLIRMIHSELTRHMLRNDRQSLPLTYRFCLAHLPCMYYTLVMYTSCLSFNMNMLYLTLLWYCISCIIVLISEWKFFMEIARMILAASSASGSSQYLLANIRQASASWIYSRDKTLIWHFKLADTANNNTQPLNFIINDKTWTAGVKP